MRRHYSEAFMITGGFFFNKNNEIQDSFTPKSYSDLKYLRKRSINIVDFGRGEKWAALEYYISLDDG